MNKETFSKLLIDTIETAFESECVRQNHAAYTIRKSMTSFVDREALIKAIVFAISSRYSTEYESDLADAIRSEVNMNVFEPKSIANRIMKTRFAQQYLINKRLKQFGSMTPFTNKGGLQQLIIKGATTEYIYASQHQTNAFLKLLRSQWPHLLGIEGRFSKRNNRSNQKLSKINVGGGNIGCKYMGFVIYAEPYAHNQTNVIRVKVTTEPGKPIGLTPKDAELYQSIRDSLGKMFGMMDIVQKVEIDTSCLIVSLKSLNFMKSPLDEATPMTAVDSLRAKVVEYQDALKTANAELMTIKRRAQELDKLIIWTESDIKTLNKSIEIMMT